MSQYFENIDAIKFEGLDSDNPLAFRHYNENEMVLGKSMKEHLRFAACYWHNFCWDGADVFGQGTFGRPWLKAGDPMTKAKEKADVAFEFFSKLGMPYYSFHDIDVAPEGDSLKDYVNNFAEMTDVLEQKQAETGRKLLWGTANVFSNPRYAAGASTNPNPEVFTYAATQVFNAMNATKRLGGENYVLWGGREGYETLLNTDLRREREQMGKFMENEFKVNIEVNHATLAGHSFHHEIATAISLGLFGSIDANRGDAQNGWDTDQFPIDVPELSLVMYDILKVGGFKTGGFMFDTKLRRQSVDPVDLFHGHIGGMDHLAIALKKAAKMIENDFVSAKLNERYAGWDANLGKAILSGEHSLESLASYAFDHSLSPKHVSGQQELMENKVNRVLFG
jgi:xylose isomerase